MKLLHSFTRSRTYLFLFIGSVFCIIIIFINLLPFLDGNNALMDFGSFYAAGLKLAAGENPYDPNSPYIFEIIFPKIGAGGKMVNLNPPISVLIFRLLPQVEPYRSLVVWQTTSIVLYIVSIFVLLQVFRERISPAKFLWAFLLAGFWHTLVLGQIYIALFLFLALGYFFLGSRNYIMAGVFIGLLIAIKPNFAIWSLFLLCSGFTVVFMVSMITALVISIIPIFFYGIEIYAQWLAASRLHQATLIMPGNSSIFGLITRFGSNSLAIALSCIIVLALLGLSRLRSHKLLMQIEFASALGIITSLLASPIAWTGYTILLIPIFFSIKKWTLPVMISASLLVVPFQVVLQFFQKSFLDSVIFGWLYGWAVLLLLVAVVRDSVVVENFEGS